MRIIRKICEKSHWPIIIVGIAVVLLKLVLPENGLINCLPLLCGVIGALLVCYPVYLWFLKRVDFDWHLINGHFLYKVVALVISVPFILTSLLQCNSSLTKELFFDESLYEQRSDTTATGVCDVTLPDSMRESQQDPPLLWAVYYHLIDPGNQHMTTTPRGRRLAALIAIIGVFLINGLLVSSIIGWIDRRKEQWKNGSVRYKPRYLGKQRYAVVIGANEIASSVIKNLFTRRRSGEINYTCEGDNDYVILQTNRNAEEVRDELSSHLSENDLKRVVIYKALRDSVSELQKLQVEHATEIYVLGESTQSDGGESYHDAMNMRCVNLIAKVLEEQRTATKKRAAETVQPKRKVCKVMFEYQTTSSIFQFSDVSVAIVNNLVFIPFNRYDSWARTVIVDASATEDCKAEGTETIAYIPIDQPCTLPGMEQRQGIAADDDTHVHFVVVGMSKMGVAMGLQVMLQAHYPNFAHAETVNDKEERVRLKDARRTRITFIDTHADQEMAFFKGRYESLFKLTRHRYVDASRCEEEALLADSTWHWIDPVKEAGGQWDHLCQEGENFMDIEIEFLKGELESEGIRSYLRHISDKSNPWVAHANLTLAICLTHTHQAVAAGLYMPISVYDKAQQIWIYQRESADIVLNLTKTSLKDKRYKKLKPFGMIYSEYMSNRAQYLKALLVNGAYDLDRKIDGDTKEVDRIDFTKKESYVGLRLSWKALTIDKRFSNRNFVDSIPSKIRSLQGVGLSNQELASLIAREEESLARCEHNRWNVQQLLFGYSPCGKEVDDELCRLNERCKAASCSNRPEELDQARKAFKQRKEELKVGEERLHPNICAYAHLDDVDNGAKSYDVKLNSIIPLIKEKVDDKIKQAAGNGRGNESKYEF